MKSLASFLSIATAATAQVVSPLAFTRAEAQVTSSTPFGLSAADDRYLQVHDDVNTARTINRLVFRLDGAETASGAIQFNATLRLSVAAAGVTALTPNANFGNNHGAGLVTHSSINFNIPASTTPVLPGRPFDRVLQLPSPFAFPGGGPLVWEIEFNSRAVSQSHGYDAAAGNGDANPQAPTATFGTGCRVTASSSPLQLTVGVSNSWQFTAIRFACLTTNAVNSSAVFILMGSSRTTFGALSLPYLLPGTTGAPSGACNLYTSVATIMPSGPLLNGSSSLVVECDIFPEMNGGNAYLQAMAVAPAANPIGIVLSNAAVMHVVAPFGAIPVGRVVGNGHGNVSGSTFPRSGIVTRFE